MFGILYIVLFDNLIFFFLYGRFWIIWGEVMKFRKLFNFIGFIFFFVEVVFIGRLGLIFFVWFLVV